MDKNVLNKRKGEKKTKKAHIAACGWGKFFFWGGGMCLISGPDSWPQDPICERLPNNCFPSGIIFADKAAPTGDRT